MKKEEIRDFLESRGLGSELIDYSLPKALYFMHPPENPHIRIPKPDRELKELMLKFEALRNHKDVVKQYPWVRSAETLVSGELLWSRDLALVKRELGKWIDRWVEEFDLTFSRRLVKRSRYPKRRDSIAVYAISRENKSKGISYRETIERIQKRDGVQLSDTALKDAKRRGFEEIYPDEEHGTIRSRRKRGLEASPLSPCQSCSNENKDECLEWKRPSYKNVMYRHSCRKLERWLVTITGPDSDRERSFDTIQGTVELESQGDQTHRQEYSQDERKPFAHPRYMGDSKNQIQRVLAGELEQAVYLRFRDEPAEIFECRTTVYEHPLIPPRKILGLEPQFEKYHIPPQEKATDPLTLLRCEHGLPSSVMNKTVISERQVNFFIFLRKHQHFPWCAQPYGDMLADFYAGKFKPLKQSGDLCNSCRPRSLPPRRRKKRFKVVVCPILGRRKRCIKHKKEYLKCSICAPPSARIFAAEKDGYKDAISDFRKSDAYVTFFDSEYKKKLQLKKFENYLGRYLKSQFNNPTAFVFALINVARDLVFCVITDLREENLDVRFEELRVMRKWLQQNDPCILPRDRATNFRSLTRTFGIAEPERDCYPLAVLDELFEPPSPQFVFTRHDGA